MRIKGKMKLRRLSGQLKKCRSFQKSGNQDEIQGDLFSMTNIESQMNKEL